MTRTLRIERVVAAAPERVWDAWTTADGLVSWWWKFLPDTAVDVDARVGGDYRIVNVTAGIGVRGEYLELDPPARLRASWIWLDEGVEGPTEQLDVRFDAHPEGTLLRIEHSGPWTSDEPGRNYEQGWNDTLPALDQLFGG
jgi:uncharacterized protein YndB with AHSA1/START domain